MTRYLVLSRLTQAIYSVFQFLAIYQFAPGGSAASYAVALSAVGFVALFDLTLSVNANSFRTLVTDGRQARALFLALLPIFIVSTSVVAIGLGLYSGHFGSGEPQWQSLLFLVSLGLFNAMNGALAVLSCDPAALTKVLRRITIADSVILTTAFAALFMKQGHVLPILVAARLTMLVAVVAFVDRHPPAMAEIAAGLAWWARQVRARISFLVVQTASSFAGSMLFALPGLILYSRAPDQAYLSYAMVVSMTNFIVAFMSSFHVMRTETLTAVARVVHEESLGLATIKMFRLVLPAYVLICAAVLICIVGIQNLPVVGIFSFLWKVSPLLLLLAMTSGALILSSQVVASGQRLEGRDHFVLPSLALGVLSSIAMLLFGTTPLRVASISLAVSVVGLAAGILQTRRAYRAG